MSWEKQLQDAFGRMSAGGEHVFAATVTAVDKDKGTCDVNDGDLDLTGVRLSAAVIERESWFYLFPAVDSTVLISTLGGKLENLAVVAVSDVEEIYIKHDTTEIIANADGLHVERDNEDLAKLIGLLIDEINKITVPTGVGPSGTPVNAAAFGQLKQKFAKIII